MRQFSTDQSSEGNPLETIQPSISESFMTKYHITERARGEGASTSYASFFHDPACVAHHLSAVKPLQHPSLPPRRFSPFSRHPRAGAGGRTTPHRDLIAIRNVAYKKSPDEHWFGRGRSVKFVSAWKQISLSSVQALLPYLSTTLG